MPTSSEATMISLHYTVSSWMSSDNFYRHPDFTSSSTDILFNWSAQNTYISHKTTHKSYIFHFNLLAVFFRISVN